MKRLKVSLLGVLFFSIASVLYSRTKKNNLGSVAIAEQTDEGTMGSLSKKNEMEAATVGSAEELSLQTAQEEEFFDPAKKEKMVINLVERGVEFLKKNRLQDVCDAFSHTRDFLDGEVYLFLFDTQGRVFAHGQETRLLWSNMYNDRDALGTLFVQRIIQTAKQGGGWLRYEWRDAIKRSYVKLIKKDGKEYVLGAGYYPLAKEDTVVGMVKGGVALFNRIVTQGVSTDVAFSTISYPLSETFVSGDLYLYALDFKGNVMAQGERPGLIGTNSWDYKDANGKLVNQEIIKKLEHVDEGTGVWVDYISKNASKKAYAEKVTDSTGKQYFIACGYYPDADRTEAVNLVRKGYQFMKASGKSAAVKEFTDKRIETYRYGDLSLVVYDMNGHVIAHGSNEELIGRNLIDEKDEDGRPYVKEIIEKAQDNGGWVDFKLKNSFQAIYVEPIDLGVDEFIITCGLFPVSKNETMTLLVKSAIGFLRTNDEETAFREFITRNSNFIRGDISIFAFDQEGVCYAYGDRFNLVWKNLIGLKDDDDRPFIKILINSAAKGPGKAVFKYNGRPFVAYVEQVEKNGKQYVLGSAFYR